MRFRAVCCAVLAVTAIVALAGPGLAVGATPADVPQRAVATDTVGTTIDIHQRPNGDARFEISTRFALTGRNRTAAFSRLGTEFEAGETGPSVAPFRRAANESSIVTNRSMNVTNVSRNATVVGEGTNGSPTGRLSLEFTWTKFARTNGSRVLVGDAFNTTQGTWLGGLTANQTLLIEAPPGYVVTRSPAGAGFSNGTVRWGGPATFAAGSPMVRFERAGGNRPPPDEGGAGLLASVPLLAVGAGGVAAGLVVVLGAYVLVWRDTDRGASARAGPPASADAADDADATEQPRDESTPEPSPVPDAELLSDEERVERLLTANGGRMKQASIVDETGWSNAKVSQLLSAMDEAERVNKLRIGRENLISLPDEE